MHGPKRVYTAFNLEFRCVFGLKINVWRQVKLQTFLQLENVYLQDDETDQIQRRRRGKTN